MMRENKSEEIECLRCGFYGAHIIYLVELKKEYMFCNCGVYRVVDSRLDETQE